MFSVLLCLCGGVPVPGNASEIIPPCQALKKDRPRVLIRPTATPYAVSLATLRAQKPDAALTRMYRQLQGLDHAAAQALLWLCTGSEKAAQKSLARLLNYRFPGRVDTFHCYLRLAELGLAYDWLWNWKGFTPEKKQRVRAQVLPLARYALKVTYDHMFHNYIWMSAGGVAVWAAATAGEDEDATNLYEKIRLRFNRGLFPAWNYLNGLPSEPMGYWALYVLSPGALALLSAQSASERDLARAASRGGHCLRKNLENLVHSTLPDLRYLPWGDLQSGPNGGVTHEMAGIIDALTWALKSPHGAFLSARIAEQRGLRRFWGETACFYVLYSRRLNLKPARPPLSFFAGTAASGHFIVRSSWSASGTVAAFTCTDHFGDHHHYDQGSFIIYRKGLLAVDPPVYRRIRGPQQRTDNHNTLLLGGKGQRPVRGQWFVTVEDFLKHLRAGRRLETGDILFHTDAGPWAAAGGRFDQGYSEKSLRLCVRQFIVVRPSVFFVVDRLAAQPGATLPEVTWLLHVPQKPKVSGAEVTATNGESSLTCRALVPGSPAVSVEKSDVRTFRVALRYRGDTSVTLIHALEVGEGAAPPAGQAPAAQVKGNVALLTARGITLRCLLEEPFGVSAQKVRP